jgi:nicotinate-nucleotide adenylyltransferase
MEFFVRASGTPAKLAAFPGSFNPVTIAHLALAEAGLGVVDEVVFVLPRAFPHKSYVGASFEQRIEMLAAAAAGRPGISVAACEGGLFSEIAEECRREYGERAGVSILCGRDAAERAAGWDYGRPDAFGEMLRGFDLLVAGRGGPYSPPAGFRGRVRLIEIPRAMEAISSTEARARIARGEPWESLIPAAARELARSCY